MAIEKKFVIDIKTGFTYGIALADDGTCKGFQPLTTVLQRLDTTTVDVFGPIQGEDPALPFGKTLYAVELTKGEATGQIYTIVVPSEEEVKKGTKPQITSLALPADLAAAGFAAAPKRLGLPASPVDEDAALKKALENIDKMIGLDTAKRDIKQNIALSRFNRMKAELKLDTKPISRHMVFTGNPGTGKTTFAREVAKVYHALGFIDKAEVTEVKREDLVAGYVGQTAIKTQDVIKKAKGGVLFIDEAYALSRDASSDSKDFGREAIDTLVAAMENMREDLIVIVAGYTEPMKRFIDANEGLKSRFTTYIDFQDYSVKELSDIMDFMLNERGYKIEADAREHLMSMIEKEKSSSKKDFGNARMVRNLVEKAEKELALRLEEENKLGKNHGLDIEVLKTALTTLTLADVKNISLEGIGKGKSKAGMAFSTSTQSSFSNDNDDDVVPSVSTKANDKKHKFGL